MVAAALVVSCVAEQSERERPSRRPSSRNRRPATQQHDSTALHILEPDRNAYVARRSGGTAASPHYTFDVDLLFANRDRFAVSLRRCLPSDEHPVYLIILLSDPPAGTEAVAAYDVINSCAEGTETIRVAGRTQRTDSITFVGPMRTDGFTGRPVGALEGTFAIVYELGRCPGPTPCPPYERVRSAPFQVVLER